MTGWYRVPTQLSKNIHFFRLVPKLQQKSRGFISKIKKNQIFGLILSYPGTLRELNYKTRYFHLFDA
jgi:hypothetical protein